MKVAKILPGMILLIILQNILLMLVRHLFKPERYFSSQKKAVF